MEQFTLVKRGYDPEEVDNYIATMENVIKSYKDKDNAIKNAIISAQVAADNMIKNAKLQADEYKLQILHELSDVRSEIDRNREHIQSFQDLYSQLIRKHLYALDEKEFSKLHNTLDNVEKLIDRLMVTDVAPSGIGDDSTPAIEFKAPTRPQ